MVVEASRYCAFGNLESARASAYRAAADSSAVVLPIIGTWAGPEGISLFVEVPYSSVTRFDDAEVVQTQLRARKCVLVTVSMLDLLNGRGELGYALACRPVVLLGDSYQPDDRDSALAVMNLQPRSGLLEGRQLIGPQRCNQCNYPVPVERAWVLGPAILCVRCKSAQEMN